MNYLNLREELRNYYWYEADIKAKDFFEECTKVLDEKAENQMSPYQMKAFQYKTITDMFEPVLFYNSPFYYETGTMAAHCDGARDFHGHSHAGGWTYRKNSPLFIEQDKELWDKRSKQAQELFYLICGPYNDVSQHFAFNYRPIFEMGFKGVYEKAVDASTTGRRRKRVFDGSMRGTFMPQKSK